jgi:hypothetical protein
MADRDAGAEITELVKGEPFGKERWHIRNINKR